MIKKFKNITPTIADSAFIAETAVVIGDVCVGESSSIWFNVVARGDVNHIRIGDRTNIQDLSMLHVTGARDAGDSGHPLIIGNDVTVGHSVVLHGCTVEHGAFIGMHSMVMDRAIVGAGAVVAAGSLVPEGTEIPPLTLWIGSPAKFKRTISAEESIRFSRISKSYCTLAMNYIAENTV
jgi:carbonic anhydrase/acetyltransferase-like protein (isoleucine patch superfamily)